PPRTRCEALRAVAAAAAHARHHGSRLPGRSRLPSGGQRRRPDHQCTGRTAALGAARSCRPAAVSSRRLHRSDSAAAPRNEAASQYRLGTRRVIVLSGATLVLPDRLLSPGTLVIENGRIAEIRPDTPSAGQAHSLFAFHGHYIVPGFVDVHVHGVEGVDALDGPSSVGTIAERLPKYGVTAFCPTTVACNPRALRSMLVQLRYAHEATRPAESRALLAP